MQNRALIPGYGPPPNCRPFRPICVYAAFIILFVCLYLCMYTYAVSRYPGECTPATLPPAQTAAWSNAFHQARDSRVREAGFDSAPADARTPPVDSSSARDLARPGADTQDRRSESLSPGSQQQSGQGRLDGAPPCIYMRPVRDMRAVVRLAAPSPRCGARARPARGGDAGSGGAPNGSEGSPKGCDSRGAGTGGRARAGRDAVQHVVHGQRRPHGRLRRIQVRTPPPPHPPNPLLPSSLPPAQRRMRSDSAAVDSDAGRLGCAATRMRGDSDAQRLGCGVVDRPLLRPRQ